MGAPDVAEAAGDRQLGAGGAHARAGDLAGVDGVADDHVEARLGGRGAEDRGEALVEHHLGVLHGLQRVLLGRDVAQALQGRGIAEADMAVGLDEARHQGGAAAVHDMGAVARQLLAGLGDLLDAVAFDQHLAGIGLRARAIQDVDVGEERAAHLILP